MLWKIWKFEVATPFHFRGRANWNMGGGYEWKVCCEMKVHLYGDIFFGKVHSLEPWKSVFWAFSFFFFFCCRLHKYHNQTHSLLHKHKTEFHFEWLSTIFKILKFFLIFNFFFFLSLEEPPHQVKNWWNSSCHLSPFLDQHFTPNRDSSQKFWLKKKHFCFNCDI